jgi:hypothetical protein
MTMHPAGTREEWLAARLGLLRQENELTRRNGHASGVIPDQSGRAAALGAADWLCLAAAPAFAIMALLTGVLDSGSPDMLCVGAPDASPLSGMVLMYLLMSAFHSAPWLKLIAGRRSGVRQIVDGVRSSDRC